MSRISISILFLFFSVYSHSQLHNYQDGEFLKYRIRYSFVNAGISTLQVKEVNLRGRKHFHVIGKGWTTGLIGTFFKVEDRYESYIDEKTSLPIKFIRKIDEGGYTKDKELAFNFSAKRVLINDKKHQKKQYINFKDAKLQDMISSFYYLRDHDTSQMKAGDAIRINFFLDGKEHLMRLKILGREYKKIKGKGKIACIKIRPYVISGRVFKEKESVTIWVTDDKNHIPVQIKASLVVGSLKADLIEYKNLKNPLVFKK